MLFKDSEKITGKKLNALMDDTAHKQIEPQSAPASTETTPKAAGVFMAKIGTGVFNATLKVWEYDFVSAWVNGNDKTEINDGDIDSAVRGVKATCLDEVGKDIAEGDAQPVAVDSLVMMHKVREDYWFTGERNDGGELKELSQTQGGADNNPPTDESWVKTDDDSPVSIQVVTDIQYDVTTHKISARFRVLKFDRGGNLKEISIEGDLVDITTAVAHVP